MSLIRKHVAVLQAWACLALVISQVHSRLLCPYEGTTHTIKRDKTLLTFLHLCLLFLSICFLPYHFPLPYIQPRVCSPSCPSIAWTQNRLIVR